MSPSNKATVCRTIESNTHNLVLSLLTAVSSSFPAGKEWKTTLSEQLSGLLLDKTMPVSELSLLYCYRFGYSISDALKFVGFNGKLQDFVDQQHRFFMHRGCISLRSASAVVDETSAGELHDVLAHEPSAAKCGTDETASFADTESTADADCEFDADSDIDNVSSRSVTSWKALGGRIAAAFDADDDEDDLPDPIAWRNVGCRVAVAFKCSGEDEHLQNSPCSSLIARGKEGEVTLSDQLAALLQNKAMPVTELSLVYCYRFGCSISDALKFVGFGGGVQDFLEQQQRFSVHHGCISLCLSILAETAKDCEMCGGDYETASTADAGSTTDAESSHHDSDSDIEITSSNSTMPWKVLGGRIAAAFHAGDDEDDDDLPDPLAWRNVGCRVAAAFEHSNEDECCQDSPDPVAWGKVGARIADALQQSIEAEDCQDSPDPIAWGNVGCRIADTLMKQCIDDECCQDSPDPIAWGKVGCRIAAAFKQSGEGEACYSSIEAA